MPCAVAETNDGMAEQGVSLYITVSPCKMPPCTGAAADQKAATICMLRSHCCNTHTSCRKSDALLDSGRFRALPRARWYKMNW